MMPIGRVDVSFLNDKEVIVSYMEVDDIGTYLRIKKVSFDGKISEPITISKLMEEGIQEFLN